MEIRTLTRIDLKHREVLANMRFPNHVLIFAESQGAKRSAFTLDNNWFEQGFTVVEDGRVTNTFQGPVLPRYPERIG